MSEENHVRKSQKLEDIILAVAFIICLMVFVIANIVTKDKKVSNRENRSLQEKPKLSADSLMSGTFMDQYEDYVSDQFAGRNIWRSLNIMLEMAGGSREQNGVFLGKNHQLLEDIADIDEDAVNASLNSINAFADSHQNISTYMMLIPDSAEVLKDRLPNFAVTNNQAELFDEIKNGLSDSVTWIDTVSVMKQHSSEKIYYKTDHHWTSLGAYYVFNEVSSVLGLSVSDDNLYDVYPVTRDFNGALSSTSGFCAKEKEQIDIYIPVNNDVSVIVNYVDDQKKTATLYDIEKLDTKDKYGVFLGGNFSMIDIKTSSDSEKTLLLVKDSFANCFIPFIAPYYKEIIVLDPRYYSGTVEEVLFTYHITDMLYLYRGNTFFEDNNISGALGE